MYMSFLLVLEFRRFFPNFGGNCLLFPEEYIPCRQHESPKDSHYFSGICRRPVGSHDQPRVTLTT